MKTPIRTVDVARGARSSCDGDAKDVLVAAQPDKFKVVVCAYVTRTWAPLPDQTGAVLKQLEEREDGHNSRYDYFLYRS